MASACVYTLESQVKRQHPGHCTELISGLVPGVQTGGRDEITSCQSQKTTPAAGAVDQADQQRLSYDCVVLVKD